MSLRKILKQTTLNLHALARNKHIQLTPITLMTIISQNIENVFISKPYKLFNFYIDSNYSSMVLSIFNLIRRVQSNGEKIHSTYGPHYKRLYHQDVVEYSHRHCHLGQNAYGSHIICMKVLPCGVGHNLNKL